MTPSAGSTSPWPPSWRRLKALARNPVFAGGTAVVTLAAIGAAILQHVREYVPNASLPLALKISLIGTLLCMGAGALFASLCPDQIKRSNSDDDFVEQQMPILKRAKADDQVRAILPHIPDLPAAEKERIRVLLTKDGQGTAMPRDHDALETFRSRYFEAAAQRYLFKDVQGADASRPALRVMIVALFAIGGALSGGVLGYRLAQALWY
jgi:hypothetical protein